MVVALPFVAIIVGLLAIAFYLSYTHAFTPLLEYLGEHVPVVGKYINRAVSGALDYLGDALKAWAKPYEDVITAWLDGLAAIVRVVPRELHALAETLHDTLGVLVTKTIPAKISAAVRPLSDAIDTLEAARARIRDDLDDVTHRVAGLPREWAADIAEARRDLRAWVVDTAVPAAVAPVARTVGALQHTVAADVLPRLGSVEDAIGSLRGRLGRVEADLGDVLPYVGAIAGAVTVAQAIEGIRAASKAKPKLDRLCTLDLDGVDDLLALALPLVSLALLVDLVYDGAAIAEDIVVEVENLVGGGEL